MANKSDLLKQAQRLASELGNKLDLTKLPKGRLPTQRDTKPEIEAAIAVLTPGPIADIAPAPEQDTEEEQQRWERIRRRAWACWANLKEKAPDKLPEQLRKMNRGYYGRMLDRLMAENPDQLKKLASDLKALADAHAPLPAKEDISTIQRNFDALKDSVTFPDELKEAGAEILAIADLRQRYDRLRIMSADTVRRLAEAFDEARMRKSLEQVSSAADDLGRQPRARKKGRPVAAAHDPARPTFPSDPEDLNANPARQPNGTAGAIEGENDVNEEQLRRIIGEEVAAKVDPLAQKLNELEQKVEAVPQVPANLVNEQGLDARLEAQRLAVENRVSEGFNSLTQDHLPALLNQLRAAVVVQRAGAAATAGQGAPAGAARAWYQQGWRLGEIAVVVLVIAVGAAAVLWGGGWFGSSGTPTAQPAQQETQPAEQEEGPRFDFSDL